ncbi:POP1-domain-containing protein [Gymnopus androsaceus JB14]|uniref:POP1-domain-containing protein n=1 Tax=Gymnopus androsaceus JB14 TaxID=1447944 RepID=A0A6A4GD14_9AGAR|nr:POP1-domain-containing protein [Gymnopus androsaceus JB14]
MLQRPACIHQEVAPLENAQATNFKERKKQKLAGARTIAVQSPDTTTNAAAGPSRLGPIINDKLKQLPGAIDVEKFAEARSFEIDAMQTAMKTASSASTTRAWQVLPRHLRRRAASHNPRRVPLRLRDKARSEMDPMRRKALGRSMPKLGKKRQLPRSVMFMKRQRDKKWLETHIWHAKRMKMENMWGKGIPTLHRASVHGSILHDASYQSVMELQGPEAALRAALDLCCDTQDVSAGTQRYTSGARIFKTHIYEPNAYPFGLICPITVMWKANPSSKPSVAANAASKAKSKKGKGKEKQVQPEPPSNKDKDIRTIWIRSHPAAVDEVFSALSDSISQVMNTYGEKGIIVDIELENITGAVGIFEIMGPKSNQVLRGALSPVMSKAGDEFQRFWASLGNIQSSGSVPPGMIIGFTVNDPRLRFPPKNAKPQLPTGTPFRLQPQCFQPLLSLHLKQPRFQPKDLNERRSKNLVPGTPLQPLRQDDRVPVMLIQTSVQAPGFNDTSSIHGWTLIFPAGWSMAFFQQLTFTGTRVAGQRECKTQTFEAGAAHFPGIILLLGPEKEEGKWRRTPPAKRVNYGKLGTRSPWVPDWEVVLGLRKARELAGGDEEGNLSENKTSSSSSRNQLWWISILINPGSSSKIPNLISDLSKMHNPERELLATLNRFRTERGLSLLGSDSNMKPDDLLQSALVSVRISICSKGAPGDLGIIYAIPDEELQEWRKGLGLNLGDHLPRTPGYRSSPESIMGYITTGGFSLSRGEGWAIGAVALTRLIELRRQADRSSSYAKLKEMLFVKVRDRKGQQCRLAQVWVMQ